MVIDDNGLNCNIPPHICFKFQAVIVVSGVKMTIYFLF